MNASPDSRTIRFLSGVYVPAFQTKRFVIAPVADLEAANLLAALLQDELALPPDWLDEELPNGTRQTADGFERRCLATQATVWRVIDRHKRQEIGAIVAHNSHEGVSVQAIVAFRFCEQGVSEEIVCPVAEWLEQNVDNNLLS